MRTSKFGRIRTYKSLEIAQKWFPMVENAYYMFVMILEMVDQRKDGVLESLRKMNLGAKVYIRFFVLGFVKSE